MTTRIARRLLTAAAVGGAAVAGRAADPLPSPLPVAPAAIPLAARPQVHVTAALIELPKDAADRLDSLYREAGENVRDPLFLSAERAKAYRAAVQELPGRKAVSEVVLVTTSGLPVFDDVTTPAAATTVLRCTPEASADGRFVKLRLRRHDDTVNVGHASNSDGVRPDVTLDAVVPDGGAAVLPAGCTADKRLLLFVSPRVKPVAAAAAVARPVPAVVPIQPWQVEVQPQVRIASMLVELPKRAADELDAHYRTAGERGRDPLFLSPEQVPAFRTAVLSTPGHKSLSEPTVVTGSGRPAFMSVNRPGPARVVLNLRCDPRVSADWRFITLGIDTERTTEADGSIQRSTTEKAHADAAVPAGGAVVLPAGVTADARTLLLVSPTVQAQADVTVPTPCPAAAPCPVAAPPVMPVAVPPLPAADPLFRSLDQGREFSRAVRDGAGNVIPHRVPTARALDAERMLRFAARAVPPVAALPAPPLPAVAPVMPPAPVPVAPSAETGKQVLLQVTVAEVPHAAVDTLIGRRPETVIDPVFLASEQARKFDADLRGTPGVNILSEPQLLLANEQTGFFQVGPTAAVAGPDGVTAAVTGPLQPNVTLRATPTVAADGRMVRFRVQYVHSTPNPTPARVGGGTVVATDTQEIETAIAVPDGGTAVVPACGTKTARQLLVITPRVVRPTPAPTQAAVVTKVYPVADLIAPIPDLVAGKPSADALDAARRAAADRLKTILTTHVRPGSWACSGDGPGQADYVDVGGALVVRHTPEVQAEVAKLFDALRRLQAHQIATEVRVVTVPADCPAGKTCGGAVLDADRAAGLIAAVQADPRVNVLQMPKVTQFNGQATCVVVGDCRSAADGAGVMAGCPGTGGLGVRAELLPVLATDGKAVKAGVRVEVTADVNGRPARLAVTDAPTVPVGHTWVADAGTITQQLRCEFGPPIVSQIPYLNRLFKNVGIAEEKRRVLVLVTPRVIDAEAVEIVQTAGSAESSAKATVLVARYREAAAAGRIEEAMRLALQALAADPACFAGK
jgi:hypothetical protein